jgi:enoyl-[acyl-carrier protein] reductase I
MNTSGLMAGKRGLIMGVANERSIAWGIAQQLHAAGAELAFSYYNEKLKSRVEPLAAQVGSDFTFECNVEDDASIARGFNTLKQRWDKIDFIVHAIAFADKECLRQPFINTTRDQFKMAMDASAYSFVAVARAAEPMLSDSASLLTLSYLGSQVIIPNYNVMGVAKAALEACTRYLAEDLGPRGIRVNTLSAGPIKTLAASAIGDFKSMLTHDAETAPLRRNVTQDDVGKAALFLLSDLASGVTGELMYVDGGANITGAMTKTSA